MRTALRSVVAAFCGLPLLVALGIGSGPACGGSELSGSADIKDTSLTEFVIYERALSLVREYTISTADKRLVGTIERSFMSWGAQYTIKDASGMSVGTVREDIWKNPLNPNNWRSTAHVEDENGTPLGTLEQITIYQGGGLFDYGLTYEIRDPEDNVLLVSDQRFELLGERFELFPEDRSESAGEVAVKYGLMTRTTRVTLSDTSVDRRLVFALLALEIEIIDRIRAEQNSNDEDSFGDDD